MRILYTLVCLLSMVLISACSQGRAEQNNFSKEQFKRGAIFGSGFVV